MGKRSGEEFVAGSLDFVCVCEWTILPSFEAAGSLDRQTETSFPPLTHVEVLSNFPKEDHRRRRHWLSGRRRKKR